MIGGFPAADGSSYADLLRRLPTVRCRSPDGTRSRVRIPPTSTSRCRGPDRRRRRAGSGSGGTRPGASWPTSVASRYRSCSCAPSSARTTHGHGSKAGDVAELHPRSAPVVRRHRFWPLADAHAARGASPPSTRSTVHRRFCRDHRPRHRGVHRSRARWVVLGMRLPSSSSATAGSSAAAGASAFTRSAVSRASTTAAAKEERVRTDRAHAALVFDNVGRAQGWCQCGGPERAAPGSSTARVYEQDAPPLPDWRITCFYVDTHHRGQGIARAALEWRAGADRPVAAAAWSRRSQRSPTGRRRRTAGSCYSATVELFEDHGFDRESDRSASTHGSSARSSHPRQPLRRRPSARWFGPRRPSGVRCRWRRSGVRWRP